MLYWILKPIISIALHGYFRRIDVIGRTWLEEDRAIYVSNHPGAMFDPILLAAVSTKPYHFIAGAEWFGKGLKAWIFKNQFNMIPVFRPWLQKDGKQVGSNKDMFAECYQSLAGGARILIYPEASSITVPWVREIKTGAARIKLGAESTNPELPAVKVIPVGMNYINPHRFTTRVTLKIGEPIQFSDVSPLDEKEQAVVMTEEIKRAMEACVLHVEEEEEFPLIKKVQKMMVQIVQSEDIKRAENDAELEFKANKEIIAAVQYFKSQPNRDTSSLEEQLEAYLEKFEALGFKKYNPFEEGKQQAFLRALLLLVGLPLFVIGIVLNGLPVMLSRELFLRLLLRKVTMEHADGQINPAFAGSLAFVMGLGSFVLWYAILAMIAATLYTAWLSIPVLIGTAMLAGRFSIFYIRVASRIFKFLKWRRIDVSTRTALLRERDELLNTLQKFRSEYLATR